MLTKSFSGSATSWTTGNVSEVPVGTTKATVRFENTSGVPIKLHYRKTGTTADHNTDITPGEYSADITIELTTARTIDYYIEGGGAITCYIVTYSTATGIPSTLGFSNSGTWQVGDLSGTLPIGTTSATVQFKNTGGSSATIHYRETGSSGDNTAVISAGEYSNNITLAIGTGRTIEYYIEGGGTLECYVVDYSTSGTTVTVDMIRSNLLDSNYSTADLSDTTIQEIIDTINNYISDAATTFQNIRGFAPNSGIKTNGVKYGALAYTLYALRTKGALRGLTSDMVIISNETADRYNGDYKEILNNLQHGLVYGA